MPVVSEVADALGDLHDALELLEAPLQGDGLVLAVVGDDVSEAVHADRSADLGDVHGQAVLVAGELVSGQALGIRAELGLALEEAASVERVGPDALDAVGEDHVPEPGASAESALLDGLDAVGHLQGPDACASAERVLSDVHVDLQGRYALAHVERLGFDHSDAVGGSVMLHGGADDQRACRSGLVSDDVHDRVVPVDDLVLYPFLDEPGLLEPYAVHVSRVVHEHYPSVREEVDLLGAPFLDADVLQLLA